MASTRIRRICDPIILYSHFFQMTLVVTSIVVLCIISALLYQLIALVEKRVL